MAAPARKIAESATSGPAKPASDKEAALAALERLARAAQTVAADEKALKAEAEKTAAPQPKAAKKFDGGRIETFAAILAVGVAATLGFMFGPHVISGEEAQPAAASYDSIAPWKAAVAQTGAPPAKVDRLAREVESLRGALRQQAQDFHKEMQALRREVAEATAHAPKAAAQAQKDGAAALDKQVARIDRLERLMADQTPVDAARAHTSKPEAGVTRAFRATPVPPGGYVLRRVVDGVAHVQSERGIEQVMVGDVLPGAGRVRAMEKRDGRWLLFTKNGVIDQNDY